MLNNMSHNSRCQEKGNQELYRCLDFLQEVQKGSETLSGTDSLSTIRRGSKINTDRFPKRRCKLVGGPGNYLDFNSLKSVFLGFWVIQTGYWPVPFCANKALQIGGLLLSKPKHLESLLRSLGSSCKILSKYIRSLYTTKPFTIFHLGKSFSSYLLWKIWPISVKRWKLVWIWVWQCHGLFHYIL